MKKRICILVQNYYDVDTRVRREAEALVGAGYSVDVIALSLEKSRRTHYILNGVNITAIPLTKIRGGKLRYLFEYAFFFLLSGLLLSYRTLVNPYQAVQVCNLPDFLLFVTLIPKIWGAKIVFDMHEIMPEFYKSKYKVSENHWMIRLMKWQEKLCFRFADEVILINDPIRSLLIARGLPEHKITIVTNSADDSLFPESLTNCHTQMDNGRFIMMYHGTLTHLYGLDIGIRAFALASPDMNSAEFWILGNGPEKETLEALSLDVGLADKVKFLGMVRQEEIANWLTQCSVGVIPTRQDEFLDLSFSTKMTEYIIMGKPVIMSRLNAINSYFSDKAIAYFTAENEQELADRMIQLYRNQDLRNEYSQCAQLEYAKINWSIMKQRFLQIYSRLDREIGE